jgi:superfamily II DNA or RNA helicase
LSDSQIRLMVAVIADGHYPSKTARCTVRLKKPRKIARMRELLSASGTCWAERFEESTGFTIFKFSTPERRKHFGDHWWAATASQRAVILGEVFRWDGSDSVNNRGRRFFSTIKESADFVQYLLATSGRRSSMRWIHRPGRKSIDYVVIEIGSGRSTNFANYALHNGNVSRVSPHRGRSYCFTVPSGFLVLRRSGYVFMTGNCGKTRTAIDLVQNDPPGPVLVICPKAVVPTWPHEMQRHAVEQWPVIALRTGSVREQVAVLDREWRNHGSGKRPLMVVVNYDRVFREPLKTWLAGRRWSTILCDESHRIKAPQGAASKAIARLSVKADRRLLLTGTPIPHSPLDLWAQFRFLEPRIFGTSFVAFRSRYAVTDKMFPSKVLRWLNLEELGGHFYSRAFRVRSADVLDLPDSIDQTLTVALSTSARRVYDSLRDELIASIDAAGGPDAISASNALVQLLRLQQITGGAVRTENGTDLRVDDAKRGALAELVEDIGNEPVVVFCRFRADLDQVAEVAAAAGIHYGELSGRRNDLDGNRLPAEVAGRPGLWGVQIQAGGSGIDLTGSAACVYWSLGFSLGEYEQSRARTLRPGQTRTVRYWHLIAEDTVDETVYHALRNRAEVVGQVLRQGIK